MKTTMLVSFLCLLATRVGAQGTSSLYPDDTLEYWQSRYAKNLRWNFENVVRPRLDSSERRNLADVELRFPLKPEREGGLFAFYSTPQTDPPVVAMPALSIKFFDDLCIAIAWLEESGYEGGTVTDYVAMLKYLPSGSFPGGRYLPPLEALHVPANALSNPRVDSMSQKLLKSGLLWVLIHELGHVHYKHLGYDRISAEQAQEQETQADRFATSIMRRIGVAPIGVAHFFAVATSLWPNRADFTSDAAWQIYMENTSHPLTTERLRTLTADLRANQEPFVRPEPNPDAALAALRTAITNMEGLARILAEEDLQQYIKKRALDAAGQADPLRPRPKER
jgi:hypothetical protein